MTRNPNLYIPRLTFEEVNPGYVVGLLAFYMGFHIGVFRVWIIIDQERGEYNTAVSIHGGGNLGISEENARKFNADGIALTDKELKTILQLLSSKRFRTFTQSAPPYKYHDAGESILFIRSSTNKVCFSAESFNFFSRDKLCHTVFQWKCLWWTRNLKHIFKRLQGKAM